MTTEQREEPMRPRKYRKRPVIVEAVRLDLDNAEQVAKWCGGALNVYGKLPLAIETLEGTMRANRGDYVIRGVKGEFYPCKADIFEATYERA